MHALVEGAMDVLFVKDRQGRYLMINEAGARLMGRTAEQIVGADDTALFAPETAARIMADDRRVMETGRAQVFEEAAVTADSRRRTYLTSKSPYRDRHGRIVGVIGVAHDTTAQKEALAAKEERLRLIARATTDGIWDWDVASGVAWWNDHLYEMWNYRPGEVSPGLNAWLSRIHPSDVDRVRSRFAEALERSDGIWSDEYRFSRPDGSCGYVFDRACILRDAQGKPVRVIGSMMDVTERRVAEETIRAWQARYEAAILASGQVVYDWDPKTNLVSFGGPLEQVLGYRWSSRSCTLEEWIGLVHPDDRTPFRSEIASVLRTRAPFHLEYRVRRADGQYISLLDDGCFVMDEAGAIVRMIGFVVDVTDQRRLQESLRQAQKMEAVGNLAGGAGP